MYIPQLKHVDSREKRHNFFLRNSLLMLLIGIIT